MCIYVDEWLMAIFGVGILFFVYFFFFAGRCHSVRLLKSALKIPQKKKTLLLFIVYVPMQNVINVLINDFEWT